MNTLNLNKTVFNFSFEMPSFRAYMMYNSMYESFLTLSQLLEYYKLSNEQQRELLESGSVQTCTVYITANNPIKESI